MHRSRTSYLSYIEETPKHFDKLQRVAKSATFAAIKRAKNSNLSITYLEDGWIVRERANGEKIKVKHIKSLSKKVNAGEKYSLS
jgi:hypothetical protein